MRRRQYYFFVVKTSGLFSLNCLANCLKVFQVISHLSLKLAWIVIPGRTKNYRPPMEVTPISWKCQNHGLNPSTMKISRIKVNRTAANWHVLTLCRTQGVSTSNTGGINPQEKSLCGCEVGFIPSWKIVSRREYMWRVDLCEKSSIKRGRPCPEF